MSKFLTPPVWYDKNGNLNEMLTGESVEEGNVVIGPGAEAGANVFNSVVIFGSAVGTQSAPTANAMIAGTGASASGTGAVAIGSGAQALTTGSISIGGTDGEKFGTTSVGRGAISIGLSAQATQIDGIAIGRDANANGGIAIGPGATTSGEINIQLGNNNTAYDLQIGNGRSTISGILKTRNFESPASSVFITNIFENRKYIFFITMRTNNDTNFYSSILFKETGTRDRIGSPIVILNNKGDLVTYRPVFVSNTTEDASTDGTLYFYYDTETTISGTVNYIKVYVLEIM